MQQLKCNICFPYVVLELTKKKTKEKGVIAYNKLFVMRFMKWHVEIERFELLFTYLMEFISTIDDISRRNGDSG